ncbi:hypothetical protein ABK040_005686 [Willaertia magna]
MKGHFFHHFSRPADQRQALMRALTTQLIKHDKITTTIQKAKQLRTFIDKMITLAKRNTPHAHNQIKSYVYELEVAEKAIKTFPKRFAERQGGYTSIERSALNRKGDNAIMATITLLDLDKAPAFEMKSKKQPKPTDKLEELYDALEKQGVNPEELGKNAEQQEQAEQTKQ